MTRKPEPFVTLGWSAISWIEHYLVHGPGDVQGQPIELDDEFGAFVLKAYRLDPKTGERRIRRAFLSRAKGRSKSGLAGFIECFEALGPCRFDHWAEAGEVSDWGYEYEEGEPVGRPLSYVEILNVATEEGQAGNTYDAVYYALNPETCSPQLLEDYPGLDVGLTRINLPDSRGFIEPVTSADTSKDGGKSTFIVADETHLWLLPRLKRLHGIMTRNLLKRKAASGWMLETSTMYGAGEGSVAEGTHAYAKSRARAGSTLLFDHVEASQEWDLNDRAQRLQALAEAYGPAAAWMNLEAIADSWDDPQVSEAEFRRFWLNQPVPMVVVETGGDLRFDLWKDLADPGAARGKPVVFGLDLSGDRDVWISALWKRPDGHVQAMLTPGSGTPEDPQPLPVRRAVDECKRLVGEWGGRVATSAFAEELEKAGVPVEDVNWPEFAAGCGALADGITDGTVRHGNQPALNNAVKAAKWRPQLQSGERAFQLKNAPEVGPAAAVARGLHVLLKAPKVVAKPLLASAGASSSPSGGSFTSDLNTMGF